MEFDDLMRKMLDAFPNAELGQDSDGQFVIYTNLHLLTPEDNPSIPLGEHLIVDMDTGQ